jgi:DNA-binding SARP family transcriptional activator
MNVRFFILGSLRIGKDHDPNLLTAPKVRQVLALLLLKANDMVPLETMLTELWPTPPHTAATTTQTYIYQIRRFFAQSASMAEAKRILATQPHGYILNIDPEQLDSTVFLKLAKKGRALFDAGLVEEATESLHEALSLSRGPVLADLAVGPVLVGHVTYLEEELNQALELRIQAEFRLGRHRELIPELGALTAAQPYNEWFHARMIEALHLAGRRGSALDVYQRLRRTLADELGLYPSPELQELHYQVLTSGAPAAASRRPSSGGQADGRRTEPPMGSRPVTEPSRAARAHQGDALRRV